jgi:hypothetical protein
MLVDGGWQRLISVTFGLSFSVMLVVKGEKLVMPIKNCFLNMGVIEQSTQYINLEER